VTAISFVFSTCKFLKAGCLGTTVLDKPRLGKFLQAWVGEMVNIPSILASILASCVRYVKWSTLAWQVCHLQLSLRWQFAEFGVDSQWTWSLPSGLCYDHPAILTIFPQCQARNIVI
jgi:hypothetical protein